VDQFISSAGFFEENGEELDFCVFGKKFAYESIREALNIFHPRYIEFQLHRVGWGGEQGNHLSSNLKEYKVYVYDFKTQQGWFKPTDNLSAPKEKH
ncbi:MAG: hypothetical protein IKO35_03080, partial [Elusimicrobiaceae bacterium]|nr:hypothetical protein [Elusimicrobiaceae bacterium]